MSMRALAKELSVTPMALYHHVGNRDELIAALIEQVFGQITSEVDSNHSPSKKIEVLLNAYCKRAVAHPELILLVFRDLRAFTGPLEDLTKCLQSYLQMTGLTGSEVEHWLGLLVDYTHGYALSSHGVRCAHSMEHHWPSYEHNIRMLIDTMTRVADREG